MIDSNNVDIIRKNIRELNHAVNPERIDDIEYQVGELENVVGGVTLPEGSTITSIVSRFDTNGDNNMKYTLGTDGTLTITIFHDFDKIERGAIQVNMSQNKIRYVHYDSSGAKDFDKSATLS